MTLFYILFLNVGIIVILKYLFMISFYKGYPVYCLRNYPFSWIYSILSFSVFFGIYLSYLHYHGENFISIYTRAFHQFKIKTNKNSSAFIFASIVSIGVFVSFLYNTIFVKNKIM